MKRLFALLLCAALAVPLAGCADTGAARKDTPTLEEGSHGADETPFIRTDSYFSETQEREMAESQNAREQSDTHASWEEALEAIYEREGNFFLRDTDMEEFREYAQDEPRDFVIRSEPGADGDKRTEALRDENGVITDFNEYIRIHNEYDMRAAEVFAALGCPTRVCTISSIEDGEEIQDYICIITVTPARLWELSGQVEELYIVERLWDSVKARFDETVWTSEGA